MASGYTGKILRVDLSNRTTTIEEKPDSFYRTYIGGRNLVGYYLLTELKTGADPLGPDNVVVFSTSVLTGAPVPGTSRYSVGAKSPLTGGYGEAEAGGWFGPYLKYAGFDAVVIKGRSEQPVYLWLHDGLAELRDARPIWGLDTLETQNAIKADLGNGSVRIAAIGPAGENMVPYACVVADLKHVNGRCGIGAVMGSKRLKAIAAFGSRKAVSHKDEARIKELVQKFHEGQKTNGIALVLRDLGTANNVLPLNAAGILPTRNFREGVFEGAAAISGEALKDTILQNRDSCLGCSVGCKRVVKTEDAFALNPEYGGPEYESIGSLGSECGVGDMKAVAKAAELCNAYGLDSISTGVSIAFAMECFEKGLLTEKDTGGIPLRFGNGEALVALVGQIAKRQGFGAFLAQGVKRMSEKIGKGSEAFAMHVKGQEFPAHEPRGKPGVGLGYAVAPTGADHIQMEHDPGFGAAGPLLTAAAPLGILEAVPTLDLTGRKVRLFTYLQLVSSLYNVLDCCIFTGATLGPFSFQDWVDMVNAATGWDVSLWELLKASERGINMARCFNLREGLTAADDTLPERAFEPLPGGPLKGVAISREDFEAAKRTYYQMAGWDPETGVPGTIKLQELSLDWALPSVQHLWR